MVNACTGRLLARARLAAAFWTRLLGLMGRRRLDPGEGLVLVSARAVHSLGMRFPIDVLYLDERGRVLRVLAPLGPGRLGPVVPGCRTIVELPAGTAARTGTRAGQCVQLGILL